MAARSSTPVTMETPSRVMAATQRDTLRKDTPELEATVTQSMSAGNIAVMASPLMAQPLMSSTTMAVTMAITSMVTAEAPSEKSKLVGPVQQEMKLQLPSAQKSVVTEFDSIMHVMMKEQPMEMDVAVHELLKLGGIVTRNLYLLYDGSFLSQAF